jgi:chromosome segregation ATPase
MKKGEAKQKIREKVLETVLETGETEKNFQEFNELNTEIGLYMKRTRKLEELNAKTVKSWKEIQESQKKFEEKFKELKEEYKALDLKDDTIQKIIGEHNEKLNRKLGVISGELDSKNKVLVIRIKKLQDELEKTRKTEAEIAGKLEQVSVNLRKKQKVLNNLQDRSLNSYRNLLHYEDMNGDTMFITERL